jgi:hypothetical protein
LFDNTKMQSPHQVLMPDRENHFTQKGNLFFVDNEDDDVYLFTH